MAEQVDKLMREHPNRFQASMDRTRRGIRQMKTRRSDAPATVVGLRGDRASDAAVAAHWHASLDGVRDRLDRIERRPELAD